MFQKQNNLQRFLVLALFILPSMSFGQSAASPEALRRMAQEYYEWRNQARPVASSDQGLHTWDDKLGDYSAATLAENADHVRKLLAQVQTMEAATRSWSRDDRIDWLIFRAQLERVAFFDRVLRFPETNPQIYVNECSSAIFSLLKKDYDTSPTARSGCHGAPEADAGVDGPG